MRYSKWVLFGCVLSFVYAAAVIRVPKLDLGKSTYATLCSTPNSALGSQFSIIDTYPAQYVRVVSLDANHPRNSSFAYINRDSDVVAKLLCLQGHTTENPRAFLAEAIQRPDYENIALAPPNYNIILFAPAFTPSWGVFFSEILFAFLVAGFCWLVGSV